MKAFELCVLLFFILMVGILCAIRNIIIKIEKNTHSVIVEEKKEIVPPYAASIMGKETL